MCNLGFYRRILTIGILLFASLSLVACMAGSPQIQPINRTPNAIAGDSLLINDWSKYKNAGRATLIDKNLCGPGSKRTAFLVTMSGGGSRAAYFSASVLHELDKIGMSPLTSQIDAIFSVSGGSIAAALYGLSTDSSVSEVQRERLVWSEELTIDKLSKNLATSMGKELVNPVTLSSYLLGNLSRTDLLQNAIDKDILESGVGTTFQSFNPDRPPIFIIATVATTESEDSHSPAPFGSLFIFSKPDFAKLGDDLDSAPIAKAVSASAAFPGLLSPVPLPRYRLSVHETQLGLPRYVHLIDGGNADNLGLLGVKRALLENNYRLLRDCEKIGVVSIDAFGKQGFHDSQNSHESSVVGWMFDHKSALASFDALLAANRARLLGEFKSRVFMPPGSEELCKKDGLSDDVCGGGVRADWREINILLKEKLYFLHLNFNSPEMVSQSSLSYCKNAYVPGGGCIEVNPKPVNDFRMVCERRNLMRRVRAIPTTFGLTEKESTDIRTFVSMLNHPKNICFQHLWRIVATNSPHSSSFYKNASASCDETPILKIDEVPSMGYIRGNIVGDIILEDMSERYETLNERCQKLEQYSHKNTIKFLKDAKERLIADPQHLGR